MSEFAISLAWLNDFVFCPASIYFHGLDGESEKMTYQTPDQLNGTAAHRAVDSAAYSSSPHILQGVSVYSEKYDLIGKIDIFDEEKGVLRERKKRIQMVYDGQVFQVYGQYVALTEMGYRVNAIELYSMDDNRCYPIPLPQDDVEMFSRFEHVLHQIKDFSLSGFVQENAAKCGRCIYAPLCPYAVCEGLL